MFNLSQIAIINGKDVLSGSGYWYFCEEFVCIRCQKMSLTENDYYEELSNYLKRYKKQLINIMNSYIISDTIMIIWIFIQNEIKFEYKYICKKCKAPKWCLHPNCLENMTSFDSNNKLHKHIRDCH